MARNIDEITEVVLLILCDIKLAKLIPWSNPRMLFDNCSYFPWYSFTKKYSKENK